jgi:hypothetical protein
MHGLYPFPFILFSCSPPQVKQPETGKLIFMVQGSNDAFPPKEVPFWGLIEKKLSLRGQ